MRRKMLTIMMIILISILIILTYFIIRIIGSVNKELSNIKQVQSKVVESQNINCNDIKLNNCTIINNLLNKENKNIKESMKINNNIILKKFESLYQENNDLAGWIKIDDTFINYPVMYTPNDKNFYLHKDWNKNDSQLGLPYIDERCNIQNSDNFIIYGHCMKSGKMFGGLKKYKNEEYCKNHNIIKFDMLNKENEYEIVSVFITNVGKESEDKEFKYYNYIDLKNEEEFKKFNENIQNKSMYKINKKLQYGDKFITLSTCDYSSADARLVVIAVKIK